MADFEHIIYTRRSIRKFLDTVVASDQIEKLLLAALLAPSGKRMYSTEFIVVDDFDTLKQLSTAKSHGASLIERAPLAIVIVADTSKYDIWIEDASIASTYIMLEAENLGLGCCWVQMRLRGTDDNKTATQNLKEILGLKEEHEIVSVLAIGYKDEKKKAYNDADLKYEKLHHNKINKGIS